MQLSKAQMYELVRRHGAEPGLDRALLAGAWGESKWDTEAVGDSGHSYGLWQMYDQGQGAGMTPAERMDPDIACDHMLPVYRAQWEKYQAEGWDGIELATRVALGAERPFGWMDPDGPAAQGYRTGYAAAAPDQEVPTMTYNPDTSPERQTSPFACSIRTATWMLRSLGIGVDANTMYERMVPGLVTPELGLLQGDGSALAPFLAEQSGQPTGHAWVNWEWLCAHAGTMPIGIGSPSLYHWVAVRGLNADGTLALANPAPGYQGLYDTMSEAQFDQWAPWAGVWIEVPNEEDTELSQAEKDELASLRDLKTYTDALVGEGGILPSALGTMEEAARGNKTALGNVVRGQCAAVREAAGI